MVGYFCHYQACPGSQGSSIKRKLVEQGNSLNSSRSEDSILCSSFFFFPSSKHLGSREGRRCILSFILLSLSAACTLKTPFSVLRIRTVEPSGEERWCIFTEHSIPATSQPWQQTRRDHGRCCLNDWGETRPLGWPVKWLHKRSACPFLHTYFLHKPA